MGVDWLVANPSWWHGVMDYLMSCVDSTLGYALFFSGLTDIQSGNTLWEEGRREKKK